MVVENYIKTKKQNSWSYSKVTFHLKTNIVTIDIEQKMASWLIRIIETNSLENSYKMTLKQMKERFEEEFENFELFWFSKPIQQLKENGIILSL